MRKHFILLVAGILLGMSPLAGQGSEWSLRKDVAFLASDLTEGRFSGSEGERLAARYISERFQAIGLKPRGTEGYYQPFTLRMPAHPHETTPSGAEISAINVIGWLDNGAATTVVIGAHYDHLGHGGHGSRHTGEPEIHNGADDNASGVAAMIYLAEALVAGGPRNNNYLFIGFSGEELGLFGSKYWVESPTVPLASVNYMLNMDMVGRLDSVLVVNGAGTSPRWKPALSALERPGFRIVTNESGIGPSDHTSFYLKEIPAIHFFTGQHSDYHKPEDDAHLVNYTGLQTVSEAILALMTALDGEGRIAFSKTKDESTQRSMGMKVTLGVMPDYTFSGAGMRLDGVMDGRPAQQAGLEKGDILIRIGETEVRSIQDYMGALSLFNKGDRTRLTVRRGDSELELEVTF
jgi:hypothetical protein